MAQRLKGKHAIVTGGTSGIGEATVARFIDEGATVVFCARNCGRGAELESKLGPNAIFKECDVGDENAVDELVAFATRRMGSIDIVVNNAARSVGGLIPQVTTAEWREGNAVVLDSVFFMSRAVIPHMQAKGGSIVNVASISGLAGDGGYPAYCAQKGAVINLTKAMAVYHARENIRINAVCPGLVTTPSTQTLESQDDLRDRWFASIPMQRPGTAEEIASLILFIASDEASFMAGSIVVADGGVTAATGQPTQTPVRI